MRYKEPLKQILITTRSCWDHSGTRPAVRQNFDRVTKCRTLALGAEVFASENEEKHVPHTCKARPCPSCGHRATRQWQREQWCSLPDIPYVGIVLTMPDVLWPIFRQNRHLLHHLPKLGATVIQQWAKLKYGVGLLIMVIPHTFGGRLNFNSHLHVLVSAGGLQESEGRWVTTLVFDEDKLMHMWRFAITDREVRFWTKDKIQKRRVNISFTPEEFVATLAEQVPNRYQHAIRYFGLLAPGSKVGPLPLCSCCWDNSSTLAHDD